MKASLHFSLTASKVSRYGIAGLSIPIVVFLLLVGTATPAWADGISVTPLYQAQVVPEEGQTVQFDYTISNNNAYPVILDYALFTIFPGPPDPGDNGSWPWFSQWFPVIAADSSSNWVVSIGISNGGPCTPADCDFGVDPTTFSSEWSPLVGSALVVPTPFNSYLVLIDNDLNLVPTANYGNGVNGLLNGVVPGSPIDVGGQQATVNGTLVVYDTPEPGTMLLLGSGLLGLAGAVRRKLRRG
jgi:hypothetical protein